MKRQHGNSGKNDLANLYGRLKNLTSDEVTRSRLHRRVMVAIEEAGSPAGGGLAWLHPLTVAAAAVLLLLGVTILMRGSSPGAPEVASILSVQANGGVHLRWADTGKPAYSVLKSTDPADFSHAQRIRVSGTHFRDRVEDAARVVYYRVE